MQFERNVGGRDRLVRGTVAIVLTAIAVRAFRRNDRTAATAAIVAAIGVGLSALICFCGVNRAFGIDTTE